jgi:hypothetical protein
MVPLPLPAGPSMAITGFIDYIFSSPISRSFPSTFMPVNKRSGADKHMEEKVPNINPNKMGKQKSKITPSKKTQSKQR